EHIEDALDNIEKKQDNFPGSSKTVILTGSQELTIDEFRQKEISYWEDLKGSIGEIEQGSRSFGELISEILKKRLQDLAVQKIFCKRAKEIQNKSKEKTDNIRIAAFTFDPKNGSSTKMEREQVLDFVGKHRAEFKPIFEKVMNRDREALLPAALVSRQDDASLDGNQPAIENLKRELRKLHSSIDFDVHDAWSEIITDFLSLTNLQKLPDDIKRLIAASPSLHPKILDRTAALEGLREYVFKYQDVSLYKEHVALASFPISCYAGFHKFKQKFPMTSFEHQEIMGVPSGKKKIPPLEIPDFLKDPSQVLVTIPGASGESESEIGLKNLSTGEPRINVEAQLVEVAIETHQAVAQEENKPDLTELVQKQIPQKQEPASPTKVVAAVKKPPSLQSEQPTSPQQLQLKGKHLQTHEAIFSANPQNVSFDAFKTLWNSLGGEILRNQGGGSHRRLQWNGQTIGGTHVPHGGNDYGPRSIRSLREALSFIGFGKDVEEVFFQKG
ncbi:MAG: hypothetical protein ACRCYP_00510, partial [Alphaproteobacteria bacterium]